MVQRAEIQFVMLDILPRYQVNNFSMSSLYQYSRCGRGLILEALRSISEFQIIVVHRT